MHAPTLYLDLRGVRGKGRQGWGKKDHLLGRYIANTGDGISVELGNLLHLS